MGIVPFPAPIKLPSDRPGRLLEERGVATLLRSTALALAALVRAFEFHEEKVESLTATTITHNLGRRPWGLVPCGQIGAPADVYELREQWTERVIVLQASAGVATFRFFVF